MAFSVTRRTSTLLGFWLLLSHFSARDPLSYADGILRQFLRHRFQERYAFDFRVNRFALFCVVGIVYEAYLNPFVAGEFSESGGLSDFYLYTRLSKFDV